VELALPSQVPALFSFPRLLTTNWRFTHKFLLIVTLFFSPSRWLYAVTTGPLFAGAFFSSLFSSFKGDVANVFLLAHVEEKKEMLVYLC